MGRYPALSSAVHAKIGVYVECVAGVLPPAELVSHYARIGTLKPTRFYHGRSLTLHKSVYFILRLLL